jgi:hypothetical protein
MRLSLRTAALAASAILVLSSLAGCGGPPPTASSQDYDEHPEKGWGGM